MVLSKTEKDVRKTQTIAWCEETKTEERDTLVSFLFVAPFRKCHILVIILVAKSPLLGWNISPGCISNKIFQYPDNIIIHHPVIERIIPMQNIASTEMLVDIVSDLFSKLCFIGFFFIIYS